MDSSVLRHLQSITAFYDRLVPRYVKHALEQQRTLEAVIGPFVNELIEFQHQLPCYLGIVEKQRERIESIKRWASALAIVHTELPKRGWYLSGQEPAGLTERLARLTKEEDWAAIDDLMVEQASTLPLDVNAFLNGLKQRSVPDCCVERVRIFLKARDEGEHEVATLVGIPLIDELCRALYNKKDFTSKRTKQPKPQMACATGSVNNRLNHYCKGFVESFGLVHQDVDPERVEDEDYFNRPAILHGMMRRSYGPKDSIKSFMILMFLVFAIDDENQTEP